MACTLTHGRWQNNTFATLSFYDCANFISFIHIRKRYNRLNGQLTTYVERTSSFNNLDFPIDNL